MIFQKNGKSQKKATDMTFEVIDGGGQDEFLPMDIKLMLIEEGSYALLKRWFPNRLPTGEDFEKWTEIAIADATAIIEWFEEKKIMGGISQ